MLKNRPHLRSLSLVPERLPALGAGFPFDVPVVRALAASEGGLALDVPVTFFVGENGSGKSTLMEAMAVALGKVAIGADDVERDVTLAPARALAEAMRFVWNKKTARGFFLRAEDFFGYAKRLGAMSSELKELEEDYERTLEGLGRQLATGLVRGQRAALDQRYGKGLDRRSHGESFLDLFQARFVPEGLYLLDEPEAPLSPTRQLSLLAMIKDMVGRGAQFIIATHAPLLMAYPGARIYAFEGGAPRLVPFDEVEHVEVTRAFLRDPEQFFRKL